jgi:hypothetical protein
VVWVCWSSLSTSGAREDVKAYDIAESYRFSAKFIRVPVDMMLLITKEIRMTAQTVSV